MHKVSLKRGKRVTQLLLASMILLVMLTGCAVKPTPPAVDCPQPPQIPASLSESSLPEAQSLSSEARSFLTDVSDYLSALR